MPDRKADLAGDLLISLPDTPGFPLSRECSCACGAPLTMKIFAKPPPCHCERSEAISSSGKDCFVTVVPRNDRSDCWFFFRRNNATSILPFLADRPPSPRFNPITTQKTLRPVAAQTPVAPRQQNVHSARRSHPGRCLRHVSTTAQYHP